MKKFTLLIASLFITIGAMAQFDANKYYTVVAEGHSKGGSPAWAVNDAGDAFVSTGNTTITNEAQEHFAFVEYKGATYLYSVSAKKFVKNNASLVAALGDAVTIEALTGTNAGKYLFKFDNDHFINIGGEKQMAIDGWGDGANEVDGGNTMTVTEAGEFTVEDLYEAKSLFIYTPSFTGAKTRTTRMVGSITVGGDTYTMPTGTRNSYTNLTATRTFTVQAGATVNLAMTQTGAEAGWMNAFVYVDTDKNGFTAGVEADGYTPTGDLVSFSFYSNSTTSDESGKNSAGTTLTGDNRNTLSPPSWTVPEDLEPGEYRIRFKYDWSNIDPAGGQGTYFGNTFTGHGGEIIDATLEVVKPYTITYNYKQGDVLICSISYKVAHGSEYPALVSGLYGVTVNGTKPTGTVTGDDEINIDVTIDMPFEYADSYENVDTWYYAVINSTNHDVETGALGDGKYMRAGTSDIPADTQTFGLSDVNAYSWGFVGDPINGFKMVSKGGKAIKTNDQHSTKAELVDDIAQGTVFTVKNPENAVDNRPDAFCLLNKNNYLNLQDGYVKQWTSADGGSTILLTQRNFDVTISSLGYATLFLDRKVYIPGGVEAYIVKSNGLNDGYITLTQATGILPKNTGVILKNTGEYEFITAVENATADVAGNLLEGTAAATEIDVEAYVLGNVDGVGLYKAKMTDGKWLNNANKAYLPASAVPNKSAAFYGFDWNGTTGVEKVEIRNEKSEIYDLTGRRVETITEPGIYIVGGRKVLVK